MSSATSPPGSHTRLDAGYLENMFQGAGLAIIACNPEGRIVAWNPAADRLHRGSGACVEGGPVIALLPERDRATAEEHFRRCVATLEPMEFRSRLGGTEDDPIEYAVYCTPVVEEGVLRGVAVWFRDITQRVKLQRALKKSERLNSLGALSGAVAHHYNNLLCSVSAAVELALNQQSVQGMRRALQRAGDALARATAITRQLLLFARADHRTTDMADLTETVLFFFDEWEQRLAERGIKLVLDWQTIPTVPVRREQMMMLLNNLVQNAIDVMPGGGTLMVHLARRDERSVLLSLADTGGGISRADMDHLFEPFQSTKADLGCGVAGKAGLGLAVVHGLVNEMHGSISAANVPGRGARFDVVLPIEPQE